MSEKVIITRLEDLPPVPCTMGGMDWNPTGLWRYLTPVLRDKAAPCFAACPAGNPIPKLMDLLAAGREDQALALLLETNPLPGVTGRLCYHPCQRDCLRRGVDRALPIQLLERLAADQGRTKAKPPKAKGPVVAVIGAGPVGLTCAYQLGRRGLRVSVHDPAPRAGGFLRGAGGLPAAVLDRELRRLVLTSGMYLALGQDCGPEEIDGRFAPALVVVDDFAHAPGTAEARALAAAWPRAGGGTAILRPRPKRGGKGFKPAQVAHAVGLGRELADQALALLEGREHRPPQAPDTVSAQDIKTGCFEPEKPVRKAPARLSRERAQQEARRCMSCGACNLCQKCVLFCPDACLSLDQGEEAVRVDLDHCKGCGVCAQECPRGVIGMEAAS